MDAKLYKVCEYEKIKKETFSTDVYPKYISGKVSFYSMGQPSGRDAHARAFDRRSFVVNADDFSVQNTVHVLYCTEVAAHAAGIFLFRFCLGSVTSGFFRINGQAEHFLPVQLLPGGAHGLVPVPGSL